MGVRGLRRLRGSLALRDPLGFYSRDGSRDHTPGSGGLRRWRVLRFLGIAVAGLAFAVPTNAVAAFAADAVPCPVPARLASVPGLAGVSVSAGTLRRIEAPDATDAVVDPLRTESGAGGPVIVLEGGPAADDPILGVLGPDGAGTVPAGSHVSGASAPGNPSVAAPAGSEPAARDAGSAPASADRSTAGSRAPPAWR